MALDVVVVVQVLDVLLGLVLSTLLVVEVHALGFGETVDLGTNETYQGLLGELVRYGLACSACCQSWNAMYR